MSISEDRQWPRTSPRWRPVRSRLPAQPVLDQPTVRELTVHTVREANDMVVALHGELDLATASMAAEQLRVAVARTGVVVVDLGGVVFMDSSGLHALLEAQRDFEHRGWILSLRGAGRQVRRLLELTRTYKAFDFEGRPG